MVFCFVGPVVLGGRFFVLWRGLDAEAAQQIFLLSWDYFPFILSIFWSSLAAGYQKDIVFSVKRLMENEG